MTILSNQADRFAGSALHPWQKVLAEAVTDPGELCRLLNLPQTLAEAADRVGRSFRLLVPRPFLERIRPGDLNDPLLRQVLPMAAESEVVEGFGRDPLCEADAMTATGLLSKYRGRSLIVATSRCGVHCRFCFRRHRPFPPAGGSDGRLEEVLGHVARDASIREVILSGGDPLVIDDSDLGEVARRVSEMGHVRRLRLHSRLPIVVPQRVTEGLLSWVRQTRLTIVVVLHVNHPAEIDGAVARAIDRLIGAGIPLLSQTVLLRGVNDRVEVLAGLFERLVDLRVMPYYLHQLDRVAGAAHFEVPEEEGLELVRRLRSELPGYAVPRYVRDIPGNPNKRVLG